MTAREDLQNQDAAQHPGIGLRLSPAAQETGGSSEYQTTHTGGFLS